MSKTNYIDIHSFDNELDQILLILEREEWVNSTQVSQKLSDLGIKIHYKRVMSILEANQKYVQRKKVTGRWHYKILKTGIDQIKHQAPVLLIEPTKAVQGVSTIQNILKNFTGSIKICDPYVDEVIFQFLDSCSQSNNIQILTKNLKNIPQIKLLISAHKTQGRSIEIRAASVNVLHDRYIIDSNSMLILGTSFNGIGKKQSFLISVGQDIRSITESYFDNLWTQATVV